MRHLIRLRSLAGALVALATCTAGLPPAVRADVSVGVGAGPFFGNHASPDGTAAASQVPLPLVELAANLGRAELLLEGMPYARTRSYGNPFDPSYSTLGVAEGVVRLYEPHRQLALGLGYGAVFDTTYRSSPPATLATTAEGLRYELHASLPVSRRSALELTFGGIPSAHGTLTTNLGIVGAQVLHDAELGSQIDAAAEFVAGPRARFWLTYGVRYLNQSLRFASGGRLVERNAGLLPFVRLNFRLHR